MIGVKRAMNKSLEQTDIKIKVSARCFLLYRVMYEMMFQFGRNLL